MTIVLVLLTILLFLVAGTALAYATGAGAGLFFIFLDMKEFLAMAPQLVFSQVDFFALMALPLLYFADSCFISSETALPIPPSLA